MTLLEIRFDPKGPKHVERIYFKDDCLVVLSPTGYEIYLDSIALEVIYSLTRQK